MSLSSAKNQIAKLKKAMGAVDVFPEEQMKPQPAPSPPSPQQQQQSYATQPNYAPPPKSFMPEPPQQPVTVQPGSVYFL